MPNGEGHDPRTLWERVRDLEQDLAKARAVNVDLVQENERLATDIESLTRTIEIIKRNADA